MIEIKISVEDNHAKSAREQFDEALAALGLMRRPFVETTVWSPLKVDPAPAPSETTVAEVVADIEARQKDLAASVIDAAIPSARVPGKPSPGKRQRTREEIAEDEKYFNDQKYLPQKAETAPAASIQPDPQDAVDEAAERAARKTGLDHDDLRQAIGRYFKKFAAPESIKNIPIILGCGIQEIPPDQIQAAIDKIDAIIASGDPLGASVSPVKSDGTIVTNVRAAQIPLPKDEQITKAHLDRLKELGPVIDKPAEAASGGLFGDEPKSEPPATRESVIDAIRGYARKYDGDVKTAADAKIAGEDIPKILYEACGKYKVGEIAPENYGAARAAVVAATQSNPFQRTAA